MGCSISPSASDQHHIQQRTKEKKIELFELDWLIDILVDMIVQVNTILSAIKRKKSMDTIILSLVASVCTFVIFIYWLTK